MFLMRGLHLTRSCASSPDNNYSLSDKSFFVLWNHLRFGLPLLLFPGTFITITLLPTYSSSRLNTCPCHFNLLSCTFLDISPTFVVPLIISFPILSSLVTPLIHLNILIPATSNFFYCAFFAAHVSAPNIIAGLATVLITFPLTLKLILRSHITPDTLCETFNCLLLISLCIVHCSNVPSVSNAMQTSSWNAIFFVPSTQVSTLAVPFFVPFVTYNSTLPITFIL